jgi:hypothetical protein
MKEHLLNLLQGLLYTTLFLAGTTIAFWAMAWGFYYIRIVNPDAIDIIGTVLAMGLIAFLFLAWSYSVGAQMREDKEKRRGR